MFRWLHSFTAKVVSVTVILVVTIVAGIIAATAYKGVMTIEQLLTESKQLRAALSNLTAESQIGYAKVLRQELRDGVLYTTLKFVETDRRDPRRSVAETICTLRGDIVHVDALIVQFDPQLVMDGEARALYLWRRVYGEYLAPDDAFAMAEPGEAPARYRQLLRELKVPEQELFWESIWELAEDPERLAKLGVRAVYGNAVYQRVRPGNVYLFRISNTGQLTPEVIPDL